MHHFLMASVHATAVCESMHTTQACLPGAACALRPPCVSVGALRMLCVVGHPFGASPPSAYSHPRSGGCMARSLLQSNNHICPNHTRSAGSHQRLPTKLFVPYV